MKANKHKVLVIRLEWHFLLMELLDFDQVDKMSKIISEKLKVNIGKHFQNICNSKWDDKHHKIDADEFFGI